MFTVDEIRIANATCRTSGASARNKDGTLRAVVPKYVESIVSKEDKILDYGAGKGAIHTLYLKDKGFDCTAYDFGENVTELHDKEALKRQYDIVFASNVLNVCSSLDMLTETLGEVWSATKVGGCIVANYPSSPRKYDIELNTLEFLLSSLIGCEVEKVDGTKSAPVWKITKKGK